MRRTLLLVALAAAAVVSAQTASGDVLPCLPSACRPDLAHMDREVFGNPFEAHSALTHLSHPKNISLVDFGTWIFNASLMPLKEQWESSTFSDRVMHVFSLSPKPEMFRIDAKTIISTGAVVANEQTIRDWAFEYQVRDSVSVQNKLPVLSDYSKLPVPSVLRRVRPNPASIFAWTVRERKKEFLNV